MIYEQTDTNQKGENAMRYEVTEDLKTGNKLIDEQHAELFKTINNLQDACSLGKGRDQISSAAKFLSEYVNKHFSDEEQLQKKTSYPGLPAHQQFHIGFKSQLNQLTTELLANGSNISTLAKLNQQIGILLSHIRTEDKKLAKHVHEHS